MKKALAAFSLIFTVAVSGCIQQPYTCETPYIVKGGGCCLDQNRNGLCDSDEGPEQGLVKNYGPYEVKAYFHSSEIPVFWSGLASSPAKHIDSYQIYSTQNETHYDGGVMQLYSSYTEEPVECLVKEYHDSALYKQESATLTAKNTGVSGAAIQLMFSKDSTPREVRYQLDCKGDESGITFQDAYVISLRPP